MIAVTVAAARATPAKAAIAVQSVRLSPRNDMGGSYGMRNGATRQPRVAGLTPPDRRVCGHRVCPLVAINSGPRPYGG
jgi:hypothetical protein